MIQRLAEGFVVDRLRPVLRLVGLVEIRVEVQAEEIAVEAGLPYGTNELLRLGILQPRGSRGHVDGRGIDFAALIHLRADGGSFLIKGGADGFDLHIVLVPVRRVLGQHAHLLRLELAENIRAAVQDGILVVGHAEAIALFLKERAVHGHEAHIGHHALKIRARIRQRILKRVIVQRLHADGLKVDRRLGGFALGGGHGALIIGFRAGNDAVEQVGGAGSVFVVQQILRGGNEIVRRHVRLNLALRVDPHRVLAQVERPREAVLGHLPFLRQRWLNVAVPVVLHQRVDYVGGNREVLGRRGRQIVERGDFGRIQRVQRILLRHARARHASRQQQHAQRDRENLLHHFSCLLFRFGQPGISASRCGWET